MQIGRDEAHRISINATFVETPIVAVWLFGETTSDSFVQTLRDVVRAAKSRADGVDVLLVDRAPNDEISSVIKRECKKLGARYRGAMRWEKPDKMIAVAQRMIEKYKRDLVCVVMHGVSPRDRDPDVCSYRLRKAGVPVVFSSNGAPVRRRRRW